MESGLCEEQLNQADTLLQSVRGGSGCGSAGGVLSGAWGADRALTVPLTMPCPQDIRLLNAGKPPQKAAEIERDLDKADAMIRLLFNDVQTLKDGRHPQGEQMYRRYGHVGFGASCSVPHAGHPGTCLAAGTAHDLYPPCPPCPPCSL